MADSTEDDSLIQKLGLLTLEIITLILGLVIHIFIIGGNVNDWWNGRSMTSVDHIVTFLGISNMCAQCANALYYLVFTCCASSPDTYFPLLTIDMFYIFFNYSCFWLTTLLSIVFCLKISNLRSRLFLYLRRVILPRTGHFIVASGLLSALNFVIDLWTVINDLIKPGTYNVTMSNLNTDCIYAASIHSFIVGASIPLIFSYISSILLFTSLYNHTVKMKMSSNLSINLETYYSAMKLVSFTFIYNTISFIGHCICAFYSYFYCVNLPWLHIILDFLPALHFSYLIYRTAKLRSQMSKVLLNVINVLFQRKDSEKERT
ncbi:taste receptor type 2 member 4-like [Ranitomeya variabilis]|uniref:taste receptor type 2 member 4-like n=1 Tax=Ranitomeya variabilis TaxID=490064 RepID=UPI004055ED69